MGLGHGLGPRAAAGARGGPGCDAVYNTGQFSNSGRDARSSFVPRLLRSLRTLTRIRRMTH
jgi:hypothetical protein